jgi:ParB family chromosome partitioning protein
VELQFIALDRIVEDPDQPRKAIEEEALAGLADSIRQHGVLNPITVAPLDGVDGFRIVTGERRWRASQLAGLYEIPAVVRRGPVADEAEKAAEQLVENLQREELAPLDKARAIARLKESIGATNKEVAQRLGLGERTVGYLLDLLDLPESIGEQIVSSPNRPADGNLTEKHGRFLRQLNDDPELQAKLADKVKADKLSSEETAKYAKYLKDNPDQADDILGESPDGLLKRFGRGGGSGDSIAGAGRGTFGDKRSGGSGDGMRESDYYAGAYDGGPYANADDKPAFSPSRGIVGIAERVPSVLNEVKVSAVADEDLPALEAALQAVRAELDRLIGEVRRRM